jgi:outer membrane murein-binding lipoprotein Lpp
MSATARKVDNSALDPAAELEAVELAYLDERAEESQATEYATRGARKLRASRPHLRMVSPLRAERASRGMFALIVTGLLIVGMVVILVVNTTIAQGAFTVSELQAQQASLTQQEQALSRSIAAAAAPDALEQRARAMGMVPSESPVFLNPDGTIVGKAKPARGATSQAPALRTPADATAAPEPAQSRIAATPAASGTDISGSETPAMLRNPPRSVSVQKMAGSL